MALSSKTFSEIITFARASSATYVNSAGLVATAANDAPRFTYAPNTLNRRGLLIEQSSTNLLLNSENFGSWALTASTVTADTIVAPNGLTTADTWTSTGATAVISQNVTKAAVALTYTASIWVKGSVTAFSFTVDNATPTNRGRAVFNLATAQITTVANEGTFTGTSATITAYPNAWYRLTLTTTTGTTTTVRPRLFFSDVGNSVNLWGAQLEQTNFVTSYISTTAATATRSADIATISTLSPWFNASNGSVFAKYSAVVSGVRSITAFDDGTANEKIGLQTDSTSGQFVVVDDGVSQCAITAGSVVTNDTYSIAGTFSDGNFTASINGRPVEIVASGTLPTVDRLRLGVDQAGNYLNGALEAVLFYPRQLSAPELVSLTAG